MVRSSQVGNIYFEFEEDSEELTLTTTTTTNTTEISLTKSMKSTKISEKNTVNSEEYTEVADLYININTATHDEFVKINGIGDYLAEQIIEYRNENGGFKNIEELINVSGIGEKIFNSICAYVYVENPIYYVETEIINETTSPEFIIEETTSEITENLPTDTLININEADKETLMLIPNIDEKIAEEIIETRNQMGRFSNVYELIYIDGLEKNEISEIIRYICV